MLYLPLRAIPALKNKLEDIRIKMNRDIKGADGTVTISSSIGVTFYNKNKNFDTLYKEADEPCINRKNGRNQITVYA